jgi:hypothetical protein
MDLRKLSSASRSAPPRLDEGILLDHHPAQSQIRRQSFLF